MQQQSLRFASVSIYYTTWAANVTARASHDDATEQDKYTGFAVWILCNHAAGKRLPSPSRFPSWSLPLAHGFVTHVGFLYLYLFSKTMILFIAALHSWNSGGKERGGRIFYGRHLSLDWNSANNPAVTCPKLHWLGIKCLKDLLVHGRRSPASGEKREIGEKITNQVQTPGKAPQKLTSKFELFIFSSLSTNNIHFLVVKAWQTTYTSCVHGPELFKRWFSGSLIDKWWWRATRRITNSGEENDRLLTKWQIIIIIYTFPVSPAAAHHHVQQLYL